MVILFWIIIYWNGLSETAANKGLPAGRQVCHYPRYFKLERSLIYSARRQAFNVSSNLGCDT